ncbi:apolipoprotein N-acyltransferase [Spirochaeta isovalerica]|uniref:Apolipoprotein N-acyltransferase n=1 Tax=Spirochaeta isovalerica TaxID=150 RepID=A0A841RBN3_9SPIO|nr:apolipoprotein N-acyltransferase [Spirochaeta isovalerica]MBB6480647.1 apolipoprotein N-acyltransferase [Spirochaeta isovalerica]
MLLSKSGKSHLIISFLAFTVLVAEVILSFFGPMATLDKTTVIVSPVYNSIGKDETFIDDLTKIIESHMVKTGSYTIVRQIRFEDYFNKHPDEVKAYQPYSDYLKIANDAGIEKMLTVSLYGNEETGYNIHLALRDCKSEILMERHSQQFFSLEELDSSTGINEAFSFSAKRVSLFDMAYIILLILFASVVLLHVMGIRRGALIELTLVVNIVLFLFSWFFARNANMDYFQKFVATKGQVTIAQDTSTEQLYAYIRFVPVFIITLWMYWKDRKEKNLYAFSLGLVILSAILYSLSFPNQLSLKGFPFLAWFALVPLFLVLEKSGFRKGLFYGSTFGVLQAIFINFWQGTYSYIGLQLVTIGLLIEYFLFMIVLNLAVKISGKWKLLIIPPLWLVFEYLRSVGYIGYPWGLIGTSQFAFSPFIQLASITGIWGLSLVLLYFNSAIAWLADGNRDAKSRRIFPAVMLSLTIVITLWGGIRIKVIENMENQADRTAKIIVVQQNRDPRKHSYQQSLDFAIEMTDAAIAELGTTPDLVLWPEGSFKPDIRWYSDESRQNYNNGKLVIQLVDYVKTIGTWLVTGTQDHIFLQEGDKEIRRNFNSSVLLSPDGSISDIYHKIKLVPFTEHFPYKEELPRMWEFLQKFDTSNWLAGWDWKVMQAGDLSIFTPICFEDAFPGHIRKYVLEGGQYIANLSNDYWSLSPVEGMQHGINGLFRAVENRRPMMRATCSGYTVYADSTGRIQGEVKEFYEKGYIIAEIPLMEKPMTFYTRYGDWLPVGAVIFTLVYLAFRPAYLLFLFLRRKYGRQ